MSEAIVAIPSEKPVVRRARVAVFLLLLIYTLNLLDRQILNILADPISKELDLSDTQIGVMTGLSFALFYTALGIPLARLADNQKADRVTLISVCLAVWSGMTALCGLAQNFYQLLACRVGVAAGEAGCTPAATSLITDLVPPHQRARAMGILGLGVPLGSLLGMLLGGLISDAYGWRTALLVAGVPGILIALLFRFVIRDPRMYRVTSEADTLPKVKLGEVLREITASRAFMWMLVGSCATTFFGYGKAVWQIVYLIRSHGFSPGEVGMTLGVSVGILGMAGTWLGGWLGDRYGSKDPRHYLTASIIGGLITVPVLIIGYTTNSPSVAVVMLAIPAFMTGLGFGPTFATIQGLVRPQSRAMAMSLKLLVQALVGLGLGPFLFGMLSDALKPIAGADSVAWVLLCGVPLMLVGAFGDWRASQHMKRELRYHT
jgi:predicted MFS family arabinose efflux permease